MSRILVKLLKIILVLVLLLVLVGVTAVLIWGHDGPPPDDADLLLARPTLAPEDNGLTYLLAATNTVYWPTAQRDLLREMVRGEKWEAGLATEVLDRNVETFRLLDKALACAAIQVSTSRNSFLDIPFTEVRNYGHLKLLLAHDNARSGRNGEAVRQAADVIALGQKMEDAGAALIGYLVGVATAEQGFTTVRQFALDGILSAEQCIHLLTLPALQSNPSIDVANAFRGEYEYGTREVLSVMESLQHKHVRSIYGIPFFIPVGSPYFYQPNNTARLYESAIGPWVKRCGSPYQDVRNAVEIEEDEKLSWTVLLRPNGVGKVMVALLEPVMGNVYLRALRMETSTSATRVILALRAFEHEHGGFPDQLNQLVPGFLGSIPRDPFDGEPLRYAKELGYIYSVGEDLNDDGGSPGEESWNDAADPTYRFVKLPAP